MVLVVIDGLDGSGKSTQAHILCNYLRNQGKTVFLRIHPSDDNLFGVKAKQYLYLRGKTAHLSAAIFYMFDVFYSILLYSKRKYDYLVIVRYFMGTAYLPPPIHRIAYHFFASILPKSDMMFFLDVNPREAYRRIQIARRRLEMFESLEELERTRHKALTLALEGKWIIMAANRPPRDIANEVEDTITRRNSTHHF